MGVAVLYEPGLPWNLRAPSTRKSIFLSVDPPLCLYGIACSRIYGLFTYELVKIAGGFPIYTQFNGVACLPVKKGPQA